MRFLFLDYTTKNDVSDYFMQWPSDPGNDAFYIQVTIMSTIPFINGESLEFTLMNHQVYIRNVEKKIFIVLQRKSTKLFGIKYSQTL